MTTREQVLALLATPHTRRELREAQADHCQGAGGAEMTAYYNEVF